MIRSSDDIFDLGPGPGTLGGRLIAEGTPESLSSNPASITGTYLIDK